jgi:hypothetical protein
VRVKYKYDTHRKVVWDIIRKLVNVGHTSQPACDDLIYQAYGGGETSVTGIINRLRKDKRHGTLNPNLRVRQNVI